MCRQEKARRKNDIAARIYRRLAERVGGQMSFGNKAVFGRTPRTMPLRLKTAARAFLSVQIKQGEARNYLRFFSGSV